MGIAASRRAVAAAAVTAGMLLAGSALGHRVLWQYLGRRAEGVLLRPGTLATLPLRLGGWVGREVPLDEAVIRATDTDELINREYVRQGGLDVIGLFLAYGVRARDLMPHRPDVCYPDQGWTLYGSRLVELVLEDGTRLPCRIYRFARGGLDARAATVLNYYIVDGRYAPDVSLLRSRIWRGSGAVRYVAQVQITCPDSSLRDPEGAVRVVCSFAEVSAAAIRALFPGIPAAKE